VDCDGDVMRDFSVRNARGVHEHKTGLYFILSRISPNFFKIYEKINLILGRKCHLCGGDLIDSIINFGESLNEKVINQGFRQGERADLCLVLGSSCTVSPACEIPDIVSRNGKLVIVNLQSTPLDSNAHLRIGAKIDEVMIPLMERLEIPIPTFKFCCFCLSFYLFTLFKIDWRDI